MALVIGVAEGDGFTVVGRHFRVSDVRPREGCVLTADDGAVFEIDQTTPRLIRPEVTVLEGLRVSRNATRLVITAPRSIDIQRDREASALVKPMSEIALLAPVPIEHLESGATTCAREGKVAFGSRADYEKFHALLSLAEAAEVSVFIYASGGPSGPPRATWTARFVGAVGSRDGAHPDGMRYRPLSTEKYPLDNKGHWLLFWEVADLRKLDEPILISKLKGAGKVRAYVATFKPEGPILIDNPL